MWDVSTGEGITVAVIDSGVNPSTDALDGQVLPGIDKSQTGRPGDAHHDYLGHGTTMAELIAGTGKNGSVQGLAPGVKILPIRIEMREGEPGNIEFGKSYSADAIRAAADSEAQIINMSFGSGLGGGASTAEAIEYAESKGKIMFAASGNEREEEGGEDNYNFPAGFAEVASVGALNRSNEVASFSSSGKVDLTAPGVDLPGWCNESFTGYCIEEGTSHATALASASAALIWAEHPDWTANQVLRVMIETTGKPIGNGGRKSKYLGYGVIRPREVLLEGKGDPGDPDQHPLMKAKADDPEESSDPGEEHDPEETPAPDGELDAGDDGAADKVAVAEPGSGDRMPVGLLIGAGGAVVVVVAGAIVFATRRRA
ncbi:S8 family serine peptidase [Streptomyces sp. JJ66]|uniref:S8 family serine peptidase n=1 Tax=Streptomyces sp. JJ66 TaxID=2803843 RepID=UPI00214ACACB|nr:S8 family serine peptidase [Streptomyces sp. JJ66]